MGVSRLSDDEARGLVTRSQSLPRRACAFSEARERSGYVRTLGGIDVFLALRARVPDVMRAEVGAAAQDHGRLLYSGPS